MPINALRITLMILLASCVLPPPAKTRPATPRSKTTTLRFVLTIAPGLAATPQSGRMLVVMDRQNGSDPVFRVGRTGLDAPPVLGRDVADLAPGKTAVLDHTAALFPLDDLAHLPVGDYTVQALLAVNRDLKSRRAPGNLYSAAQKVHLDPVSGGTVRITLTQVVPPEQMPPDTDYVKYIKLESKLLSRFYGRPIFLRAGVILPRDYGRDPARRYPLRVHIGGFGARYTGAGNMMAPGSSFRALWLADDTPRMLLLHLDGDSPFGDPYQVNSANSGPYGDAITQELIPYVEQKFRGIGQPYARVLDGASTGGWVSLALQVFYPDFFNGTWTSCPDPVDFRAYELIDIYSDKNAYVNRSGFERPSARQTNGDTLFTVRHECQIENVLGAQDCYTTSGEQWGAWDATFSPRGPDGRPLPLWDPQTGKIDPAVAAQWKPYDLRLVLEANWKTLGPKLRGKLHIWVGDADNYFLNNAVHLLDAFLSHADPPYGGEIVYGPGQGHGWYGITPRQMMEEMAAATKPH